MPELVDGSDGAQDIALAGILKKSHEANRNVPTTAKLGERERSTPCPRSNERNHEPDHRATHQRGPLPGSQAPEPVRVPNPAKAEHAGRTGPEGRQEPEP